MLLDYLPPASLLYVNVVVLPIRAQSSVEASQPLGKKRINFEYFYISKIFS
jgi:hypothetical protein